MTLLMSVGNKEQRDIEAMGWVDDVAGPSGGCRDGQQAWPRHLESRVLAAKVGDLRGLAEESAEGQCPGFWPLNRPLGWSDTGTPREALVAHSQVTVSDPECSFWYPQPVGASHPRTSLKPPLNRPPD